MGEIKRNLIMSVVVIVTVMLTLTSVSVNAKKAGTITGPRKEDITYIKCQVCEKLANQLYQQVQKKQNQISPKKISEYQIIEIAENVCNLKKEEADWIMKIDIVEKGDKLELVEQESEGHCNSECKTIEHACQEVIGFSDTDVAEYIYTAKPQLDSLVTYLCKDLSKACSKPPPPVPKDRTPGEPFVLKPSKELEMEKMMRSMEGLPGAPGMKMYSREDLMNNNLGKEDDDEDDDDEENTDFSANLKRVLKEKGSPNSDWKQTIKKGIKSTSETLRRHANKISLKMRKWWKGMKGAQTKKDSKSKSKTTKSKSEL